MSDLMLGFGQMLAIVVIVGGVTTALWQVWVLANKLCRNLDREVAVPPGESYLHLQAVDRRTQNKTAPGVDTRGYRRPEVR